jgi:hypothetical protein
MKAVTNQIGTISLRINGSSVDPHPFVKDFIENTISGMLAALKGTSAIKDLYLTVEGDSVGIILNGASIILNAMTNKMIKTTIVSLVSSVEDVAEIKKLSIIIHKTTVQD